jgi:hypothetical protein
MTNDTSSTPPDRFHEPGAKRDDADILFRQELQSGAARLLFAGQPIEAGLLSLAAHRLSELASDVQWLQGLREVTTPAQVPETTSRARQAAARASTAGQCRHKFNESGVCTKCGAAKKRGGRPPSAAAAEGAAEVTAPPADPRGDAAARTVPLPLGDAAADKFSGGGLGSSGRRV